MTLKEQYYNNPEDDVHAFDNLWFSRSFSLFWSTEINWTCRKDYK